MHDDESSGRHRPSDETVTLRRERPKTSEPSSRSFTATRGGLTLSWGWVLTTAVSVFFGGHLESEATHGPDPLIEQIRVEMRQQEARSTERFQELQQDVRDLRSSLSALHR